MTIAHISDLHFGRIANDHVVGALVEEINRLQFDLVALSGDITQRARPSEFRAAATMLDAIQPPTVVVPGNHDVYPWWNPVQRLTNPLGRYRHYISEDLTPQYERDGIAVLGVNTAHGRTIKGGKIRAGTADELRQFFGPRDNGLFKVLVLHHHLTKIQALRPHDVARRARRALRAASEVGVDLILCGHLHISHIEPVEVVPGQHPVIVASAGTATSNRGRKWHRRINFYNYIEIGPDAFTIEERRYVPAADSFVVDDHSEFVRFLSSVPRG